MGRQTTRSGRHSARPSGRRQRRRARRRRLLALTLAVGAVVAATGVWLATSGGNGPDAGPLEATGRPKASAVPTTTPPTTTAPKPAGPPFALGATKVTVEDPTRPTPARGPTPASTSRRLPLTIYYPTTGTAGADVVENAPAATGTFPLIIFAHGFAITAAAYDNLTRDLAAGGFIVVAPDFPLSSLAVPGPPLPKDLPNQSKDIDFLITVFQTASSTPSMLLGHIAAGKVGVAGHSDGGSSAAASAGNSCCLDTRIGAAAIMAGDGGDFPGTWGQTSAAPFLFLHGTDDTVVHYQFGRQLYDVTRVSKIMVSVTGGSHLEPFVTGPQRPTIVTLVLDFFRSRLQGDAAATARITADANVAGVLKLEASA